MPGFRRRVIRKSSVRRVHKTNIRFHKRGGRIRRSNPNVWVNKTKMAAHQFLPRRILTKVVTTMTGYVPGAAGASGFFGINASSLFEPFNSVSNQMTGTGKITLGGSYSLTSNPMGYSELSGLYNYYKVHGAKLKVTCIPTANIDTLQYTVYPAIFQDSVGNPTVNIEQPYSKWRVTNAGASAREAEMVCHSKSRFVLGMNKGEYNGQAPTLISTYPLTINQWFYNVQWNTLNSTVNSNEIQWVFELTQYIEVLEMIKVVA